MHHFYKLYFNSRVRLIVIFFFMLKLNFDISVLRKTKDFSHTLIYLLTVKIKYI